jgi:hypothetical protein
MDLPQVPCASEAEALGRARELAEKRGRPIEIEIRLNDGPLYDRANMRRRIRKENHE